MADENEVNETQAPELPPAVSPSPVPATARRSAPAKLAIFALGFLVIYFGARAIERSQHAWREELAPVTRTLVSARKKVLALDEGTRTYQQLYEDSDSVRDKLHDVESELELIRPSDREDELAARRLISDMVEQLQSYADLTVEAYRAEMEARTARALAKVNYDAMMSTKQLGESFPNTRQTANMFRSQFDGYKSAMQGKYVEADILDAKSAETFLARDKVKSSIDSLTRKIDKQIVDPPQYVLP